MAEPEGHDEVDVDAVLGDYDGWLTRQPLAARTRDAYLAQARDFVTWLAGSEHGARALSYPDVRDWAVRDYKRYVKTTKRWGPASINQALAAIDNFYRSRGAARPEVAREELAQTAPRALTEAEQRTFLRCVQASPSERDRAIATVFFYAGLRLSELGALDVTDVALSARRGRVTVRAGKDCSAAPRGRRRPCRTALDEWFAARTKQLIAHAAKGAGERETTSALWLSRSGARMGTRAIDLVIRRLAAEAGLELSAHVLRHTCVTNLIRSGADVVMVAEIAGHRRLDTTRRYSLPSQADKDAALEAVVLET